MSAAAARLRVLFVDDEARITRARKALFRDLEVHTCNDPQPSQCLCNTAAPL